MSFSIAKKLLAVCVSLALPAILSAQIVKFTGTIRDKSTKEPLVGASIVVKGTTQGASADINGKFALSVDVSSAKVLMTSYLGYQSTEVTVTDKSKAYLDILISENAIQTKEVEVVSSRLSEKIQESPITIERMGIQAIKETPAANFYDALANLKGVDMTASSLTFKVINTRGFNSTSPVRSLQIIDGMDNQAPGLNFSLGNFVGASELDVESVELIVGANSALYGPNAFNGVINMTTKDPYKYPGLNVQVKSGYHPVYDPNNKTYIPNLYDGAIRYAKAFDNGFAFKLNAAMIRADDWRALNFGASSNSLNREGSPQGFDRVNMYGDEYYFVTSKGALRDAAIPDTNRLLIYRTGYRESDIIGDNTTTSIKGSAGLFYRKANNTLSYVYNFGTGTSVYQAENRYRLKDILFQQHKLQLEGKRFFIKAYTTAEDAGKSYDVTFTGVKMQEASKQNLLWNRSYQDGYRFALQNTDVYDTYEKRMQFATNYADTLNNPADGGIAKLTPGTQAYVDTFNKIINNASFIKGGTRFVDNSSLYHFEAGYTFDLRKLERSAVIRSTTEGPPEDDLDPDLLDEDTDDGIRKVRTKKTKIGGQTYEIIEDTSYILPKELKVGASMRVYAPKSYGTILSDTLLRRSNAGKYANRDFSSGIGDFMLYKQGNKPDIADFTRIRIYDFGTYLATEKKVLNDKLNLSLAMRLDYRLNYRSDSTGTMQRDLTYKPLFSPTISGVYQLSKNNFLRLTGSTAIRYPTLQEQYLYYNIGRALLLGNTRGDSLITRDDFLAYLGGQKDFTDLKYQYLAPVRPERVWTAEIGFKGILFKGLYVDANVYYSYYQHFLGYVFGVKFLPNGDLDKAYRIFTNARSKVTSLGAGIGLNYYFPKYFSLSGNYTYAEVHKSDASDPIVPGFNTPTHKYNLGFGARNLFKTYGFYINYKYVGDVFYQASPQFTGFIGSYNLLDAQVTYHIIPWNADVKLGVSNILGNLHYEAYGGPLIGTMGYISLNVEL